MQGRKLYVTMPDGSQWAAAQAILAWARSAGNPGGAYLPSMTTP